MITKKTFGKQRVKQKRFKSVGDNELNVSDKNFIKNNCDKFTVQQIAIRVGKTSELVEKFMKKNKIAVLKTDSVDETEKIEESDEDEEDKQIETKIKETKISLNSIENLNNYFEKKDKERQIIHNFIKNNGQKLTVKEISTELNLSEDKVRRQFKLLGLNPISGRGKKIDPKIEEYLRQNYRTMTAREMSQAIGNMTFQEVVNACVKLNLIRTLEETTAIRLRWRKPELGFGERDVKFVKENHGVIPISKIAAELKLKVGYVNKIIKLHGLKVTKEQISKLNAREQVKKEL